MRKKLMLLLETEVLADSQHASLILWLHWRFQHGDMVSDTILEFLNKKSRIASKLKSLTSGLSKETLGKSSEVTLCILWSLVALFESTKTVTLKEHTGKGVKLLLRKLMILQCQVTILTTQITWDFGGLDLATNSTSILSIREIILGQFRRDKMQSISRVSYIQTTQLLKGKSFVLSSSTSSVVHQLETSFVGIKASMETTGQSLLRKTKSNLMTLIRQLLPLSFYVFWLMKRSRTMMLHGKLCIIHLPTQTILSFQKPLKNGQLVSSKNYFLVISI